VEGEGAKKRLDRPGRASGGPLDRSDEADKLAGKGIEALRKAKESGVGSDGDDDGDADGRKKCGRIGRASGGKVGKGKTTINVIVGGQQQQPPQKVPVPIPVPQGAPPAPVRPPMAMAGAGAPQMPPAASPAGPVGLPPAGVGPVPRKRGGRVGEYKGAPQPKEGDRGGEARAQKIKDEKEFARKNP
jgi:hypothetical protein